MGTCLSMAGDLAHELGVDIAAQVIENKMDEEENPYEDYGDEYGDEEDDEFTTAMKEALNEAAKWAEENTAGVGKFLNNPDIRIPLPEEIQKIQGMISSAPGVGDMLNDLVRSMNEAAEQACEGAADIFIDVISSMDAADALSLIKSTSEDAITSFLKEGSLSDLEDLMRGPIENAMEACSVAQIWETFSTTYNNIKSAGGGIMTIGMGMGGSELPDLDPDLTEYILGLGLAGIFLFIASKEKLLRQNPLGAVSSVVQKIFGQYAPQSKGQAAGSSTYGQGFTSGANPTQPYAQGAGWAPPRGSNGAPPPRPGQGFGGMPPPRPGQGQGGMPPPGPGPTQGRQWSSIGGPDQGPAPPAPTQVNSWPPPADDPPPPPPPTGCGGAAPPGRPPAENYNRPYNQNYGRTSAPQSYDRPYFQNNGSSNYSQSYGQAYSNQGGYGQQGGYNQRYGQQGGGGYGNQGGQYGRNSAPARQPEPEDNSYGGRAMGAIREFM